MDIIAWYEPQVNRQITKSFYFCFVPKCCWIGQSEGRGKREKKPRNHFGFGVFHWWRQSLQIRTFYIIESDGLGTVFVVKGQNDFVLVNIHGIYKAINKPLLCVLVGYIRFLKLFKEESNLLTKLQRHIQKIPVPAYRVMSTTTINHQHQDRNYTSHQNQTYPDQASSKQPNNASDPPTKYHHRTWSRSLYH